MHVIFTVRLLIWHLFFLHSVSHYLKLPPNPAQTQLKPISNPLKPHPKPSPTPWSCK